VRFRAKLFKYPGPGGWNFATIPKKYAPPVTEGWGRTPVLARVDGRSWATSVWRDRKLGTLLPVPKRLRLEKGDGDWVEVELLPPRPAADHADLKQSAPLRLRAKIRGR
jgi:hypothetical protein